MKSTKMFLTILTIMGLSLASGDSNAAKYNKLIANPFVFCSAPKPCKACEPFRKIYEDICDGNKPKKQFITPTEKPELAPMPQPETKKGTEGHITENVK